MPLTTPLCSLFGIRHPILLAPMGGVSGGALAAAVTRAGGLGLIGGGYGDRAWLERELAAAGNERVGVGFITWSLARTPLLLDLVLERAPAAVFLSFGDARPYVDKVKGKGSKLILQVQTLGQAAEARSCGADLIVAQGTEAGGHGAIHRALFPLVPAVVDTVAPTLVAAAGGIADGRQLAAALLLGAAGVVVGTRFFASRESLGHANAKARIVAKGGDDTLRTRTFDVVRELPWPKQYTGRAIANSLSERWHDRDEAFTAALAAEAPRYRAAVTAGDFDTAVIFAGEGLDLVRDIPAAGEIVERLAGEAETLLRRAPRLVGPHS
ncbi:MAG TPA: nitronate monooxygenase [Candidatus Sulfotelmatobacter sp.]|nr:nitronate monooxygenase [Candidatus Sulfotelmatobacter sp.]